MFSEPPGLARSGARRCLVASTSVVRTAELRVLVRPARQPSFSGTSAKGSSR